jgi:hypothetical protein
MITRLRTFLRQRRPQWRTTTLPGMVIIGGARRWQWRSRSWLIERAIITPVDDAPIAPDYPQ